MHRTRKRTRKRNRTVYQRGGSGSLFGDDDDSSYSPAYDGPIDSQPGPIYGPANLSPRPVYGPENRSPNRCVSSPERYSPEGKAYTGARVVKTVPRTIYTGDPQALITLMDTCWGEGEYAGEDGVLTEEEKVGLVKEMILSGINLNETDNRPDSEGFTALIWAVIYNKKDIVGELINSGADTDFSASPPANFTALMLASVQGNLDIVNTFIKLGTDINLKNPHTGYTALMWGVEGNHPHIVDALIKIGADINVENQQNYTALKMASKRGHSQIISILMRAAKDKKMKGKDGEAGRRIKRVRKKTKKKKKRNKRGRRRTKNGRFR